MLLLPAPRLPKDASRAVNRVAQLKIEDVSPESLSQLLNFPRMRVDKFAIEQQGDE